MFKILLIDDERGILEGLQFILESAGKNWEIVGSAEDGQEGYEKAIETEPDIIISDIRMPLMDGIEMIGKLKRAGCRAKYILLSGYSEFEYARQAISLGVKFYVCKPIEEEELFLAMEKICAEIKAEQSAREQMIHLENQVADLKKDRKEVVFGRILAEGGTEEEIAQILEEYHIPSDAGSYLFVQWECNGSNSLSGGYQEELMRQILICLGDYANVEAVKISSVRMGIVIADDSVLQEETIVHKLACMKEKMEELYDIPVSIGIGSIENNYLRITDSFENAGIALNNKVIQGIGSIICYSGMSKGKGSRLLITEKEISELEQVINECNMDGCKEVIHKIFHKIRHQEGITLSDVQMQSMNMILAGLRTMPFMQFQLNEYLGKNILSLESISRFHTMEQLENWIINIVTGIAELQGRQDTNKRQDAVGQIKDYIKEHYTTEISLNELAKKFFLNPYYLSQMFKKKTGMTYQSYVTSLRVERAKQLFQEKDYKVYEVCELVGYSDTAYFSKVFEKQEGCKPSEYRRLIMERHNV